jgi:hypothetical protein
LWLWNVDECTCFQPIWLWKSGFWYAVSLYVCIAVHLTRAQTDGQILFVFSSQESVHLRPVPGESLHSSKWIAGYNFKISNSWFTLHRHLVGTSNLSPFDATVQSDMVSQSLQSTGSKMILSSAVIVKLLSLLSPVTFHSNRHHWRK